MQSVLFNRTQDEAMALLERVSAPVGSELPLPRLLLVFAHPDDEVLALGGRLERMAASKLLTLTDGAPIDGRDARNHGFSTLDSYREGRRTELKAALAHAGLGEHIVLPFPDKVPDQTASLHLQELARAVAEQIAAFQPEAVLTHPYEGGHPDHDACAFAVHCGVRLLAGGRLEHAPLILEAPSYHVAEDGSICTGAFLPEPESKAWVAVDLTEAENMNKQARLACFVSQAETLAQFGAVRELFRVAPRYDFTAPPHTGQLFYERFPWGLTGKSFRTLAATAIEQMFPAAKDGIRQSSSENVASRS